MMCRQSDVDILPYVRARYQAIAHAVETKHTMVIAAPKTASTTRKWHDRFAPKGISSEVIHVTADAENFKLIPCKKAIPVLERSLNMADALGIDSAIQVLDEAKKQIKSDLEKLRSGEI